MDNVDVAALILAGGQSSRMGRDKALVVVDGKPLLQRVYEVAAGCCDGVYVLTPWPERYQSLLSPSVCCLRESSPGQGPLVAFADGLAQIPLSWVLLLACDMPGLQMEILQGWMGQLQQIPDSILAFVPRQDNRWEPLCGFYRRQGLGKLQQFLAVGGRSFQGWLSTISVEPFGLTSSESRMLWNCNTPEDLNLT